MLKTIKAKFKNGVFEPLEEIKLSDGTEAHITFDSDLWESEDEKLKIFLSSSGSWKDYIGEDFLDEIYEQRKRRNIR